MWTFLAALALFADGVVFNSRPLEHHAWNQALGIPLTDEQYQDMVGLHRHELTDYFYHHFGCAWDPEVFDRQRAEYGLIFAKGITLKSGMRAFLERAQEELILVTSVSEEETAMGLKNCFLEGVFSEVISSDSLRSGLIYLTDSAKIAERLNSLGFNALVIKDLDTP
jgi:beta-phosphoglucomutase-like phosphatase (HAD superfamily)